MLHRYTKAALLCAVLPIGLLAAGCSTSSRSEQNVAVSENPGLGEHGFDAFAAGNYSEAKAEFTNDYHNDTSSPLTQYNMGASYRQEGDMRRANGMYSEAAGSGKDYRPSRFQEPDSRNATIREMACRHLHEDHQLDVNCGDQMAAAVPVPVAVEAAATTYAAPNYPPKQDRN